jgi:hypothetical protein
MADRPQPARDLAAVLAHQVAWLGAGQVVWRSVRLQGVLDRAPRLVRDAIGEPVLDTGTVLLVLARDVPAAAQVGDTLTVDGVSHQVRLIERPADGELARVWLSD